MRSLGAVVEALVAAVLDAGDQSPFRLAVTAQLVGDQHPRQAPLLDQLAQEPLRSCGVTPGLHQNIEHIAVAVDRPPEPVRLAANPDHHLVEMPFIIWSGPIMPDLAGELGAEFHDPGADRLIAHRHATLGQQILDITKTHIEAYVRPNGVADNLTGKAVAFQAA